MGFEVSAAYDNATTVEIADIGNAIDTRIHMDDVPLRALRSRTRELLAAYLNRRKILPSENSYWRDWRGLYDLSGVSKAYYASVEAHTNPTEALLQRWQADCPNTATVGRLQRCLLDIDRLDCLDDNRENFESDAKEYLRTKPKVAVPASSDLQLETKPTSPIDENSNDLHVLTEDDVRNGTKQRYDALMLYAEDNAEDAAFAVRILDEMTVKRNLKICHSGLYLGGTLFEHVIQRELLEDRCHRLIVLLSPAFVQSPKNQFATNMAQAMGIENKTRKLIPIVLKEFNVPQHYKHIHMLNFSRTGYLYNFWEKLHNSVIIEPESLSTRAPLRSPVAEKQLPIITVTTSHHVDAAKPSKREDAYADDDDDDATLDKKRQIYPPESVNRRNARSMLNLSVSPKVTASDDDAMWSTDSGSVKCSRSMKERVLVKPFKRMMNLLSRPKVTASDPNLCAPTKTKVQKKMAMFAS